MKTTLKQEINIKLATTVGHFYVTLTLKMFIWLDHLVLTFPVSYLNWHEWVKLNGRYHHAKFEKAILLAITHYTKGM